MGAQHEYAPDFEVFEFCIEGRKDSTSYAKNVATNNINKLSLIGMQQPEKYKEKFDVTSRLVSSYSVTPDERPRSKRRISPYIFR